MMITSNEELIRRIYRFRRLLATHKVAAESTFQIVRNLGVTQQQVQEICAAEDQHRRELMQTLGATMRELSK
jgi:hypothetical protein